MKTVRINTIPTRNRSGFTINVLVNGKLAQVAQANLCNVVEVRNHICAEWSHKLDVSEVKAGEIDWPAEYRRGARA